MLLTYTDHEQRQNWKLKHYGLQKCSIIDDVDISEWFRKIIILKSINLISKIKYIKIKSLIALIT